MYIAGSSNPMEKGRVSAAMSMVKSHPNMHLTLDWLEIIEAAGSANAGLSYAVRHKAALDDIEGVITANVLWLLAPDNGGKGCWFEAGVAEGWNRAAKMPQQQIQIIASGNTQQSIFCACMQEFATDRDAFFKLAGFADAFVESFV